MLNVKALTSLLRREAGITQPTILFFALWEGLQKKIVIEA